MRHGGGLRLGGEGEKQGGDKLSTGGVRQVTVGLRGREGQSEVNAVVFSSSSLSSASEVNKCSCTSQESVLVKNVSSESGGSESPGVKVVSLTLIRISSSGSTGVGDVSCWLWVLVSHEVTVMC